MFLTSRLSFMSQNSNLVHIKRKKEGEFGSLLEQLIFITNECDVIYYNWWNKNIHFFFLSHEIKVKRKALSSATSNFLFNFFFLSQSYGKRICPNCSHGKLNLSLVVCGMWIYWLMETVRPTVYVYLLKKINEISSFSTKFYTYLFMFNFSTSTLGMITLRRVGVNSHLFFLFFLSLFAFLLNTHFSDKKWPTSRTFTLILTQNRKRNIIV